jgi:hypothetical protein
MISDRKILRGAISALIVATLVGCEAGIDANISALGDRFLLNVEPQGALSISEAKEKFSEEEASFDLVIIGRVAPRDVASLDQHHAVFSISDLTPPGHDHASGHDEDNCAFCRHRAEQAPIAFVEVVDDNGTTLPYGAARLFGLRKGDVLIIRGQAQLNKKLNLLSVRPDGFFIRR